MAGTTTGGKLAAQTNIRLYGEDFYARIGAIGGKKGKTGGFYANRELARIAGAKGGRKSRRRSIPRPGYTAVDFGFAGPHYAPLLSTKKTFIQRIKERISK